MATVRTGTHHDEIKTFKHDLREKIKATIKKASLGGGAGIELPPVGCPVLGVWSDGDIACGEAQMLASAKRVSGPWHYQRIRGAGHWIPLDAPEELSNLLLDFLAESP